MSAIRVLAGPTPDVELLVHDSGAEDFTFTSSTGSVCVTAAPGTADAIAGIDQEIQYAPDEAWGQPGWLALCGDVRVDVPAPGQLAVSFFAAGASDLTTVRFEGVNDVRESARQFTDAVAAAWNGHLSSGV